MINIKEIDHLMNNLLRKYCHPCKIGSEVISMKEGISNCESLPQLARFGALDNISFQFQHKLAQSVSGDFVICQSEGIPAGEFRDSVRRLGVIEFNRANVFSRVGMGRCQGRIFAPAAAGLLTNELGNPIEDIGRLCGQAPATLASLSQLAAEVTEQ